MSDDDERLAKALKVGNAVLRAVEAMPEGEELNTDTVIKTLGRAAVEALIDNDRTIVIWT